MKQISALFLILISFLISCDECRYAEPKAPLIICQDDSIILNIFQAKDARSFSPAIELEDLIILENNDTAFYRIDPNDNIIIFSSVFSNVDPHSLIDSTLNSVFVLQFEQNHFDTLSIEGRISLVPAPVFCGENQKNLVYHPLMIKHNGELILEESNSTGISCQDRIISLYK